MLINPYCDSIAKRIDTSKPDDIIAASMLSLFLSSITLPPLSASLLMLGDAGLTDVGNQGYA